MTWNIMSKKHTGEISNNAPRPRSITLLCLSQISRTDLRAGSSVVDKVDWIKKVLAINFK